MTYFPKRADNNQREIVAAFRQLGYGVQSLHEVGKGCPDLLISKHGKVHVVECKSSVGKLRESQTRWAMNWRAPVYICRSVKQVLAIDEALRNGQTKRFEVDCTDDFGGLFASPRANIAAA